MKSGDKVVCVKASISLIEKEIYTIDRVIFNGRAVTLKEVSPKSGKVGFYSWRFRPVDYDFADNVLENIKEQLKEDYILN